MKSVMVVGRVSTGLYPSWAVSTANGTHRSRRSVGISVHGGNNVRICYVLRVGDNHRETV